MTTPVMLVNPQAAAARSDAWHAARRDGIGASEIAAVLGISPWESPFSLYWRKVHGWDVEETDEMRTGTRVEPVVADWWADECDPHENLAVRPAGLYAHPDRPWQRATPDRLVYLACPACGGSGLEGDLALDGLGACPDCLGSRPGTTGYPLAVLECKWTATWDGWGEPGTDEIPVYYRTQVLWQCDVLDVDEWHLAFLGPGGFRSYHGRIVNRDERDLVLMREHGRRFMDRLAAGDAPDVDEHAATARTLKQLHPSIEDVDVEVGVDFAEGYRRARDLARRTAALVDRYDARARQILGNGRRLMCNRKLVVSRSIYEQAGDSAELMAIDDAWPTVDRLNPGRSKSYV